MSELISNRDAMIALENGRKVEFSVCGSEWDNALNVNIGVFLNPEKFNDFKFRLKPQTITINGIEVPAPFKPKEGDMVWSLNEFSAKGYEARTAYHSDDFIPLIAYWRTENEIKQVVEALKSVFKPQ